MQTLTHNPTLALPRSLRHPAVRTMLGALAGAALILVGAQVRFVLPDNPVPVTLQTPAVLLCGFLLLPRTAALAVLAYLALGFALPGEGVFAALRVGQSVATLGYLVGFLPAAVLVSFAARSAGRLAAGHTLALTFVGTAVVFCCGVGWLAAVTGSLDRAVQLGLLPFVGWAVVKAALVTGVVQVMGYVRPSRLPFA